MISVSVTGWPSNARRQAASASRARRRAHVLDQRSDRGAQPFLSGSRSGTSVRPPLDVERGLAAEEHDLRPGYAGGACAARFGHGSAAPRAAPDRPRRVRAALDPRRSAGAGRSFPCASRRRDGPAPRSPLWSSMCARHRASGSRSGSRGERFDGRPVTETEIMPLLVEAGFLAPTATELCCAPNF